jgi:hypothetical protein
LLASLPACGKELYPVTEGSIGLLPKPPARLVIVGHDAAAAMAAEAWLLKRGLTVLDRRKMQKTMADVAVESDVMNDQVLLQEARTLQADEIVRIETQSQSGTDSGRSILVAIRALDVNSGLPAWEAKAAFSQTDFWYEDATAKLTCQALATVWGFRPAGYHKISSSKMCEIHDRDVPPPSAQKHLG